MSPKKNTSSPKKRTRSLSPVLNDASDSSEHDKKKSNASQNTTYDSNTLVILTTQLAKGNNIQTACEYTKNNCKVFGHLNFQNKVDVNKVSKKVNKLKSAYTNNKPAKGTPKISHFYKAPNTKPRTFNGNNEAWEAHVEIEKKNWIGIIENLEKS